MGSDTNRNTDIAKMKTWFQALILKSLQAVDSFKISIFIQLILLKRKMVNFELGEEIEKDFCHLVTSMGQSKKSESSCRIEPRTFRFSAQILKSLTQRLTMLVKDEITHFHNHHPVKLKLSICPSLDFSLLKKQM